MTNCNMVSCRRLLYFVLTFSLIVIFQSILPQNDEYLERTPIYKLNIYHYSINTTLIPLISKKITTNGIAHTKNERYPPKNTIENSSVSEINISKITDVFENNSKNLHVKIVSRDPDGHIIYVSDNMGDIRRQRYDKYMGEADDGSNTFLAVSDVGTKAYLKDWDEVPTDLKKYAPMVFKFVPKRLEPHFKNPCWINDTNHLQCLPYFYILGMTKCGTSDVWNKTVVHPQIIDTKKEVHWWTNRFISSHHLEQQSLFVPNTRFLKYLTRASEENYHVVYEERKLISKMVLGDGSPSTIWNNLHWRKVYPNRTDGPPYINADVIHAVTPNAKFILTLRDPVSRLYSSYNFFGRHGYRSPEHFHQKAVATVELFENCMRHNGIRACVYQPNLYENEKDPIRTGFRGGIYNVLLQDWFRIFHRDQILLIELSDWHSNCTDNLSSIYKHLSLDDVSDDFVRNSCDQPTRVSPNKKQSPPMLEKTKIYLQEKYQPYNEELYILLQDSRFDWRYNIN